MENMDFSEDVGIVQFFLNGDLRKNVDPIHSLTDNLTLSFDILSDEYSFLEARIIACDQFWKRSNVSTLDYLQAPNNISITDFSYSVNTRIAYVNYQIKLPGFKLSGNYLVEIWNTDNNKKLLSRRIVVYEPLVTINAKILYSQNISRRQSHHQIVFDLAYDQVEVFNPYADLYVAILQNHNWEYHLAGLRPTLTRADEKLLEYRLYSGENEFPAGNEFRLADLRATQFRGINVKAVRRGSVGFDLTLDTDKPKNQQPYSGLNQDENGGFLIANLDPDQLEGQADYVRAQFSLASTPYPYEVYVVGKFNNWKSNERSRLSYNADLQQYETDLILKQGLYDYQYVTEKPDEPYPEGNFAETENEYEIIVYQQGPSQQKDRIIGYQKVSSRN